ncbi:hypothetical protein CDAR_190181 [Caerostris darwini]|uniref:Cytochrome P450 n=1 Tax=Caerostris darwini TaxID=1538125 RepID=A0AAV4WR46_9ARAC|nr:hypothetical protein CDAR_190181 [Caerostris darwini]
MIFEIVVCAFIGIIAVLAILTLWRMKYSRFVSDNKHSVFQVLLDVMDSILFVTSGKKNALHLYIAKYFTEKSKKFEQYPLFTYWLCGLQVITIHKGKAVKEFLKEKKNNRKSDFYDFFTPYLGTGLLTCDGSQWKGRKGSCSLLASRAACSRYLAVFNSMRRSWSSVRGRRRIHVR